MRVQFSVLRPHHVWASELHYRHYFSKTTSCAETSHGAFYFALLKSTMKPKMNGSNGC